MMSEQRITGKVLEKEIRVLNTQLTINKISHVQENGQLSKEFKLVQEYGTYGVDLLVYGNYKRVMNGTAKEVKMFIKGLRGMISLINL